MPMCNHYVIATTIVLCQLPMLAALAPAERASLLPKPAQTQWLTGELTLDAATTIQYADPNTQTEALTLAEMLRPATGYPLRIEPANPTAANRILLQLGAEQNKSPAIGPEGYVLTVDAHQVQITAQSPAGLFYGGQTLRQLLPPAIFAKSPQTPVKWTVPCCRIVDSPRFGWRGYMLDFSRHFFDLNYARHLLDAMALHKLNVFHMHLADDDGWRIEIKKYPKLTAIGAWRGTACPLPNTRKGETFDRYGGFFTQDQMRELVAYAARLHINIMPEIDLPGHSLALCTAYPETRPTAASDAVSVDGHKANAISPANEANYAMVDDIIAELAPIFPFEYFHIGGDEVNHNLWKSCPKIKAFMEREKIANLHDAQAYFTKRLEGILARHKKRMIGWNEITNAKLERSTTIMAWIGAGAGYHAAREGFPVVMAPGPHMYFDMAYIGANDEPPAHWWAGQIDWQRCYAFDPLADKAMPAEQAARFLGVHACLWSEFIVPFTSKSGWAQFKTPGEVADYDTFPRLCALAEMGWTPQDLRNADDFARRLGPDHLQRLKNASVGFRLSPPDAQMHKGAIQVLPPFPGADVRYTLDGSDPFNSKTAIRWDGSPITASASSFHARTFFAGMVSPLHVGARAETFAKVITSIPAYQHNTADKLADRDPKTFFWSSRGLHNGETITIVIENGIALSSIEWKSGQDANPSRDSLPSGIVEISADGTSFHKVADFSNGAAKAAFPKETIKAIRLTVTADTGKNWVILHDPVLK